MSPTGAHRRDSLCWKGIKAGQRGGETAAVWYHSPLLLLFCSQAHFFLPSLPYASFFATLQITSSLVSCTLRFATDELTWSADIPSVKMRAQSIAAFLALTLVVPTFSAPVPSVDVNVRRSTLSFSAFLTRTQARSLPYQDVEVRDFEARSFAAHYTFSGNEVGPVAAPAKPPTTPRAHARLLAKQRDRAALQASVASRVQAVMDKAGPALGLSSGLVVDIYTTFHSSVHDATHATFRFNAPPCGGMCVGHAFQSDAGGYPGRVFSASHVVLYGPK